MKLRPIDQHTQLSEIDTTYLRTGFYYLADGEDGIVKKCESDEKIYTLSKTPFASVDDVSDTELKWEKIEGKTYPELCLHFNEKGKQALAEGTGNPLHPQIAAVIAGKLLYVVDNRPESKTTGGTMCVYIIGSGVGISGLEVEAMKRAVDEKR
jgi:preprotein translocase subunit SecD